MKFTDKIKETDRSIKMPIITFILMIALIGFIFGSNILMTYLAEDTLSAVTLTPEQTNALNKLYDAGDYEGLIKLINSSNEYDHMWNYEHYDFVSFYSKYVEVRDVFLPLLDKKELTQVQARQLTESVFAFYYRVYDHTMGTAGNTSDNDIEVLDGIKNDVMYDILFNRMGFTEQDMESARSEIMEDNYFHSDRADKFSDSYYERFR